MYYNNSIPRTPLSDEDRERGGRVVAAIKTKRHTVGLTAAEVAQRSGIPLDTIRSIEQGRTVTPSFLVVAGIARALGASTNEFAEAIWGNE